MVQPTNHSWPTERAYGRPEQSTGYDRCNAGTAADKNGAVSSSPAENIFLHILKACVPLLVSIGLLAWLVDRIHWDELLAALVGLNWLLLVPVTVVLVMSLWDGVCLRTLFSTNESPVSYRQCLRARGISYLASVINYEMGQAILAWRMARDQRSDFMPAVSRTVLLAYHDLLVLLSFGLLGAVLGTHKFAVHARSSCLAGLTALLSLGIFPYFLGLRFRQRLQQTKWGAWWVGWTWNNTRRLLACRAVYYLILTVYGGAAFSIGGLAVNYTTVLSTIPLVLLADALPSISGLGTRDAVLQILLPTSEKQTLLAISLVWSVGVILGRTGLGLLHLWRQHVSDPSG